MQQKPLSKNYFQKMIMLCLTLSINNVKQHDLSKQNRKKEKKKEEEAMKHK
jgi:hypothetical protein